MNANKNFFLLLAFFLGLFVSYCQSPVGTWATIDDETGKVKSHVQIYEKDGKLYGKIIKLLIKPENENCTKCSGAMKNKPLIGLEIMKGLKKDGEEWTGGTIVDPKKGKEYSCTVTMENKDKLKLRGYIGISLIGRTQYWTRVK